MDFELALTIAVGWLLGTIFVRVFDWIIMMIVAAVGKN